MLGRSMLFLLKLSSLNTTCYAIRRSCPLNSTQAKSDILHDSLQPDNNPAAAVFMHAVSGHRFTVQRSQWNSTPSPWSARFIGDHLPRPIGGVVGIVLEWCTPGIHIPTITHGSLCFH